VKRQITEGEAREDKVYQKLQHRLSWRTWLRAAMGEQDGTSCRSPQMKQPFTFCPQADGGSQDAVLIAAGAEDANALQVGLIRIQKAVIEDTISNEKPGCCCIPCNWR